MTPARDCQAREATVWQTALEDVGLLGVDKKRRGKCVILRAGYKRELPAGYAPLRAATYSADALLRVNMKSHGGADVAAAVNYGKGMKFYLLSTTANPPATVFTDVKDDDDDSTIRFGWGSCRGRHPVEAAARPQAECTSSKPQGPQ